MPFIAKGRFRTLEEVDHIVRLCKAELLGMTPATIAAPTLSENPHDFDIGRDLYTLSKNMTFGLEPVGLGTDPLRRWDDGACPPACS